MEAAGSSEALSLHQNKNDVTFRKKKPLVLLKRMQKQVAVNGETKTVVLTMSWRSGRRKKKFGGTGLEILEQ
jgi:hypothetical protein